MNEALVAHAHDEPQTNDTDDALAVAAASTPEAFGTLYERYRLSVYRYLRARTPNDDEALELTAVTFERALAAIARYPPVGQDFRPGFSASRETLRSIAPDDRLTPRYQNTSLMTTPT